MIRVIVGVVFAILASFQSDEHIKWFMTIFALLLMVWDGVDTARSNIVENQAVIDKKLKAILDCLGEIDRRLKKLEEGSK